MDNPVAPPVNPPEIFVEQQVIVIALRRKMFIEKQSVIKDELKAGWHVKDIQLGVGKMGTNGFMSILLEREYGFTAPLQPDGSTTLQPWYSSTTETHYRDPHGLGDDEPYTLKDGEEIGDEQPYTFNDDGPDDDIRPIDDDIRPIEDDDDETQVVD